MLKKLAVLLTVFFTVSITIAQVGQGTIKGKMTDKANGEPLPFANVVVLKGGSQVAGTMTDFDGKYTIAALPPGQYTLQATYVGYQPIKVDNIVVNGGKITFVPDIKASQGAGVDLDEFEVIAYEVPLIDKDQTSSGGTITREDIAKMPGRSAASIAQTVGGVYSQDDGGTDLNIRGARSSSNVTFIDGVRVRGTQNLPNSAIEQVAVITGGIPAEYGDATGGVVNITTRGASKEWFGGIEYLTSGFKSGNDVVGLDKFGFNLLAGSVSGPILTKKDSLGNKKDAIMGFFLSGEAKHELDPRPSVIGNFKVKDEVMEELNANPYLISTDQVGGVQNAANFLRSSDLEETPFRLNVARKSLNLAGKIDITTSKTTNVTVGGSFDYRNGNNYIRNFALLNSQNNSENINTTYRVYARFTQRFANSTTEGEDASLISNAFISFQADFENFNSKNQHKEHQDQLSHYGYVGKFTSTIVDQIGSVEETSYVQDPNKHGEVDDTLRDVNGDPVFITGYFSQPFSVLYSYEPGDLNPVLANYNNNYYDAFQNTPSGFWDSPTSLQGNGGLLNGSNPLDVYGIWSPMGIQSNNYSYGNNAQFRISANGSADIKNHAIKIGFQYEQRNDRFYTIAPTGLWTIGRGLVNNQITQRSFEEGSYTEIPGYNNSLSAYILTRYYDESAHKQFDKNLRQSLGMEEQGLNFIDFDSYGPDVWNIGMFTPDELFTSGSSPITYYGYDHTGKKLSGNPSVDDFFTKKDENGNFTRENPSFQPIYVAGYIQDKFAFDDLIFNVGVRIDRYDANQSVLKDQYSLFPVKTVGEVELDNPIAQKPSNIGDDFVVYVTDAGNPTVNDVVGYRDGDTWYNAKGEEISNPKVLSSSGIPQPWLVKANKRSVFQDLNGESFKDFEPQVNISPRIAFSFPISDEALFFAHYDVLTQRPSSNNRMDLPSYLNFGQGGYSFFGVGNPFNNPDLKSEQTIDYELGFQQKLSNYSALKIAAFYREMRDQIQMVQVLGAYPGDYFTYGNRDFGTVKGMTFSFDLRRKGNVSLRASYTLQFADGTGSNTSTSSALVSSGFGNLRTLIPLSYDQRHAFVLTGDYRYGEGKNYTGPVLFGKNILQNTGLNIIYRAGSGTPYTRRTASDGRGVLISTVGTSNIDGQFNASRLPWSTTVDAKLDRTVNLKWGKGEEEDRKEASLNIYIQVLNVLNAKNILGVYGVTGNADDDGFLASAHAQQTISQQQDEQSYRDLYAAKMANPFNYALPRRIRLGIQLNF